MAEQSAAVLAGKLAGIERRVVDAEAREKTAVAKLSELEKQSQHVARELNTARLQVQPDKLDWMPLLANWTMPGRLL